MFWRIDRPVLLVPRTVSVTPAVARAYGLSESWTVVDAHADGRLLLPALGDADCRSHDNVAIDFDPTTHEHRGFCAQRRVGNFVVWIPHFHGPHIERFFPPPPHLAGVIPALGPDAYESLRSRMPLPPPETVTALSASEAVACLRHFDSRSPFHFDKEDVARLDGSRLVAATNSDVETVAKALAGFLAEASVQERSLRWAALEQAPATELWLETPNEGTPYSHFGHHGDSWAFRFPELHVAGFLPKP